MIDEEVLDAYVRSLMKSAESINKFINYIELKSMIRRFRTLNPHLDPRVIDWVGVWDERLTYEEQVANFRMHYPMYRWEEVSVVPEAFEKAKEDALWEMIRGLDEDSLRKLAHLIEKELGKLQKEQAVQVISQVTSTLPQEEQKSTPTTVHSTPPITLRTLAGVPVLLEARAFVSAFSVEELCNPKLLREARGRVMAGLEDFVWPFGDPVQDLLSFYAALYILSQIQDRRIWERWAETERQRAERFMNAAVNDETLEAIWKDMIIRAERCGPDEEARTGLPYRIHVTDFQRLVKGIDGAEWRLENRKFWRGWVYVTRRELVRLLSEEVKSRILKRLEEVKVDKVPEPIKETVERIRVMLTIKSKTQTPP